MDGLEQIQLDNQAPPAEIEHEVLPPILRRVFADTLIIIINNLDHVSFVKLSRTCRYLYNFCWNARGIRIPFNCRVDLRDTGFFQVWTGNVSPYLLTDDRSRRNWTAVEVRNMVEQRVFRVNVEFISMHELSEVSIAVTNWFLTGIGCETSDRLRISNAAGASSNSMIQFCTKLGVKEFRCNSALPDDAIEYLLENMTSFCYANRIPDRFYREVSVPRCLFLMDGNTIPYPEYLEILDRWAQGDIDIEEWMIRRNHPQHGYRVIDELFDHFKWADISDLFNVPLPPARPLLLLGWDSSTYLLRNNGEILELSFVSLPREGNILLLRRPKNVILRIFLAKMFPTTDDCLFEFPGANYSYGSRKRWRVTLCR